MPKSWPCQQSGHWWRSTVRSRNGEIVERFRTLLPGTDDRHSRAFSFMEAPDEEVQETLDLASLAGARGETR